MMAVSGEGSSASRAAAAKGAPMYARSYRGIIAKLKPATGIENRESHQQLRPSAQLQIVRLAGQRLLGRV